MGAGCRLSGEKKGIIQLLRGPSLEDSLMKGGGGTQICLRNAKYFSVEEGNQSLECMQER